MPAFGHDMQESRGGSPTRMHGCKKLSNSPQDVRAIWPCGSQESSTCWQHAEQCAGRVQPLRVTGAARRQQQARGPAPARLAPGQHLVLSAAGAAGLVARVVVLQRARAPVCAQRLQCSA